MKASRFLATFAVAFAFLGAFSAAQEKVSVKLAVPKGEVRWYKMQLDGANEFDTGMGAMESGQKLTSTLSITALAADDKGRQEFEINFIDVKGEVDDPMSGEKIQIDTTKPSDDKEESPMAGPARSIARLAGKKFKMTLGADGRMEKIEAEGRERGPRGGGMGGMGNVDPAEIAKKFFGDVLSLVPSAPVAAGEATDVAEPVSLMMFKAAAKGKKTVEKVSAEELELAMNAKIDGSSLNTAEDGAKAGEKAGDKQERPQGQDRDAMKEMLSKMTFDEGQLNRRLKLSRKDGFMQSGETSMKVGVTMPNNFGGGDGDITISINLKTSLVRAEAPQSMPAKAEPAASQPAKN